MQIKKKQSTKTDSKNLKERFDKLKKPVYRKVRLTYSDCCGCGCYDQTIERKVPVDSPLKDGDRVKKFESDDIVIDDDE